MDWSSFSVADADIGIAKDQHDALFDAGCNEVLTNPQKCKSLWNTHKI